jgi:pimeloyl-ACP methyl ester carboxylesterase
VRTSGGRRILVGSGPGTAAAWRALAASPGEFDAAVFDGPPPAPWRVLDRGLDRFPGRIVATPGSEPPPSIPFRSAPDLEAALAEAAS